MQRRWWMLVAIMVGISACADDPGNGAKADEQQLGGLELPLVSVDALGRGYRLRNATFTVAPEFYYTYPYNYDAGAPTASVLSTETPTDDDYLRMPLIPGYYRVTLGGDWYIERTTATGPERVQNVVLLSESVQQTYIYYDSYSNVRFSFGVDGTLLDFRHGNLNVSIDIELPNDGGVATSWPQYPQYDAGSPWYNY